jgi:hypothetical protein
MLRLATLYVRNRHKPASGQPDLVAGRELLERAQAILTSEDISIASDSGATRWRHHRSLSKVK